MATPKRQYLTLLDVLVVTLILFGQAIYASTLIFFNTQGTGSPEMTAVTADQNLYMIGYQGTMLLLALAYLYFRSFDFKQWTIRYSLKDTGIAVLMFLGLALAMDALFLIADGNFRATISYYPWDFFSGLQAMVGQLQPSLIAYALLNGVYEELYFIGMLTAVSDKHKPFILILSLLVRISFHTYQGLLSALGIGLILGLFYYVWYQKKSRNLYPIFLSHALADIWGLSLLTYLIAAHF